MGLPLFSVVFLRELGRQRSTIELDTPSVKPAQLQALEDAVNEKIRVHVPVTVQLLSLDDPALEKVHILRLLGLKYRLYCAIKDSKIKVLDTVSRHFFLQYVT